MLFCFSVPLYAPPSLDFDDNGSTLDKIIPRLSENGSHGFTIVGNSGSNNESTTNLQSHQLKVQAELFDVLSNNTEIDHPLCDECCDTLMTLVDSELRSAEEECSQYEDFLKKCDTFQKYQNNIGIKFINQKLPLLSIFRLETEPDNDDIETLEAKLKDVIEQFTYHQRTE